MNHDIEQAQALHEYPDDQKALESAWADVRRHLAREKELIQQLEAAEARLSALQVTQEPQSIACFASGLQLDDED